MKTIVTAAISDGLRVPVGREYFKLLHRRNHVQDVYTAIEDQICGARGLALAGLKLVAEPSAVVAFASVLYNPYFHACLARDKSLKNIGVVLMGANISFDTLLQIVNSHGKAGLISGYKGKKAPQPRHGASA